MELSCGVRFTSFWTHNGNQYMFSPEKRFLPVSQPTQPKKSKKELFRERLRKRLDDVEESVENRPDDNEPFQGVQANVVNDEELIE